MKFYFFEFDEEEDNDDEIPIEFYRTFLVDSNNDRYPDELKLLIDGSHWDLEAPPYIVKKLVIKRCA